jgi:ABC-type multidrug transport system ATPase subunit
VDALTLSVKAGEVFGLLAANGAGKTTTIKMPTTLLPPTSGEARVAGFSIVAQAVGVRRAIGYVPQSVSVDGLPVTKACSSSRNFTICRTANNSHGSRRLWIS